MCGRYTVTDPDALRDEFGVDELPPELAARFNVAPTQRVPVVVERGDRRRIELMRWGLVPPWAEDVRIGNRLINARVESASAKPAFRDAFVSRRCLVAASGFYEWQRQGKHRTPFYLRRLDRRPLAFAGLWERWKPPDGDWLLSVAILTTDASEVVAPIHDRMPLIVDRRDYGRWLAPEPVQDEALAELVGATGAVELEAYEVSAAVNSPRNDGPELLERGPAQQRLF